MAAVALLAIPTSNTSLTVILGKSKVINKALTDIGMGKYQWCLFTLCGFGWLADKYVQAEYPITQTQSC